MASNHIPKNAARLAAYMRAIEIGDDLHREDRPFPAAFRSLLEAARRRLELSNLRISSARAGLSKAMQEHREAKDHATRTTRRARNHAQALHSETSPVLADYGLRPRRRWGSIRRRSRRKG